MAGTIRPVSARDELADVFDLLGAQFEPAIDRRDERRFADLRQVFPDQRDLLLVAEADGEPVGGALGFFSAPDSVTLRILAVAVSYRRQGVGRALLRAFESAARLLGGERVSLGADEEAGFYVRHGYRTMLLLQWAYDASLHDAESAAVLAGPLHGMEHSHSFFDGVPQLFVVLDEPNPAVRARVSDLVEGAHVGYCMTKLLGLGDSTSLENPDRGRMAQQP